MASKESSRSERAYLFYSETLKSPKYVAAPMVDHSELPFRMLCRKYGAQLCYTPMFHSGIFLKDKVYRAKVFTTAPNDRPLIAQFCANNPQTLLEAARIVEDKCDAIDINLGCPQTIAKRGNYGAFLQENWELIGQLVSILHENLKIPVTCKIRIFSDIKKTVEYARFLESKGCSLLAVHGRTRVQKGVLTGLASWEHIIAVKQAVSIPVFANGNILRFDDVTKCLLTTGVDGVMSAEGILYNPALFSGDTPSMYRMAREYMEMVKLYPVHTSTIRGHLFKILHRLLQVEPFDRFRQEIATTRDCEGVLAIIDRIGKELYERGVGDQWICEPYKHHSETKHTKVEGSESEMNLESRDILNEKEDRSSDKNEKSLSEVKQKLPNAKKPKLQLYTLCVVCSSNPLSMRCEHKLCRKCCRTKCVEQTVNCDGHKFKPKGLNVT